MIRFAIEDLLEQLEAFAARWPDAKVDERGRFVGLPAAVAGEALPRLVPPLLAPRLRSGESVADYIDRCADFDIVEGEQYAVVLMRAGAVALGIWRGNELLSHKAIRKYVVRGKGRAQPTYLRSKGKSRYGSRLRLQNWKRLLKETNEWLNDAWAQLGIPQRVFYSAPVRVQVDLRDAEPPPPFAVTDPGSVRIPIHVHRPDHAELLRVRATLAWGHVELPAD